MFFDKKANFQKLIYGLVRKEQNKLNSKSMELMYMLAHGKFYIKTFLFNSPFKSTVSHERIRVQSGIY